LANEKPMVRWPSVVLIMAAFFKGQRLLDEAEELLQLCLQANAVVQS
jgi:hypothetical protein